jgi:hypothetical protein
MSALRESVDRSAARQSDASPAPVAFPGRWVGGAVGVAATILVAVALRWIELLADDPDRLVDSDLIGAAGVVALLGIPVAFVLGRHLAPVVRDGGWTSAVGTAVTFAFLAPPLGDIEIIGGLGLVPWMTGGTSDIASAFAGGLIVGGIGLVVSYIALPVTAAVAVVWVVLMRALPPELPAHVAMPRPISRVGVRHVVLALAAWLVVAWSVWTLVRPTPIDPWS